VGGGAFRDYFLWNSSIHNVKLLHDVLLWGGYKDKAGKTRKQRDSQEASVWCFSTGDLQITASPWLHLSQSKKFSVHYLQLATFFIFCHITVCTEHCYLFPSSLLQLLMVWLAGQWGSGHRILGLVTAPFTNREAELCYESHLFGRQICLTNYFICPCEYILIANI